VVVAPAAGVLPALAPAQPGVPPGGLRPAHPEQKEQFSSFVNKALGWFTVSLGASLLAAGQTWGITERYERPVWLFWLLFIVMGGLSVLNTALRMSRDITRPRP